MSAPPMNQKSPRYLYFPGCCVKGFGMASGESLVTLFSLLGLPLDELEDWNCCGATSYMSVDEELAFTLASRNLSLASQAGCRDLIAYCSACYLVLTKTQNYVKQYPQLGERVNEALHRAGLPSPGPIHIRHPLDVLYNDVGLEQIRAKMVRPWRGGRIACYYGCQAVRPYSEADRPHNPMRMDELLRAVGADTVDFPLKTKCCGGSLIGTIHQVGIRLIYIILKEALRKGAQAIATICPLCQFNLDVYQAEINKQTGEHFDLPVLYFTQILGWSLGGEQDALGLRRAISGRARVKEWFAPKPEVEAYV